MGTAKLQASLRIRVVSTEYKLFAYVSSGQGETSAKGLGEGLGMYTERLICWDVRRALFLQGGSNGDNVGLNQHVQTQSQQTFHSMSIPSTLSVKSGSTRSWLI